jgi:hypothetical protein
MYATIKATAFCLICLNIFISRCECIHQQSYCSTLIVLARFVFETLGGTFVYIRFILLLVIFCFQSSVNTHSVSVIDSLDKRLCYAQLGFTVTVNKKSTVGGVLCESASQCRTF